MKNPSRPLKRKYIYLYLFYLNLNVYIHSLQIRLLSTYYRLYNTVFTDELELSRFRMNQVCISYWLLMNQSYLAFCTSPIIQPVCSELIIFFNSFSATEPKLLTQPVNLALVYIQPMMQRMLSMLVIKYMLPENKDLIYYMTCQAQGVVSYLNNNTKIKLKICYG